MRTIEALPAALRIGEWEVAPELNQIRRPDECLRLEPKAIGLLVFLAQRPGEAVSREELLNALWPGVVVGDNALTQVVTKLRKALGDTARQPSYIESISKRGYRLIAAVERPLGPVSSPALPDAPALVQPVANRRRRVVGALGVIAVVATATYAWWRSDEEALSDLAGLPPSVLTDKHPTVFVRPIEAIGEEPERLMARGLTADLVSDLSKLSGLWVVSAEATPNPTPRDAQRAPTRNAGRYAVTGTLQSDSTALRLQIRLVDVESGRELWSQRFERKVSDLFAVQDELVRSVVEQLPVEVSQAELASLALRYTSNVTAYEHFLRGQTAVLARRREHNELARQWYWKAIELDPTFSRAYAGLALTYAVAFQLGWENESALSRAAELAATAEQLNPNLPETHWVLGFVDTQRRRHAEAVRHLQRALRLNPSYADAYALIGGIKTYTGEPAEGVSLLRTALRLNPDAGSLYFLLLGRALYFVGDHEQARVHLEQALNRNAESVESRVYLALVLRHLGDQQGAAWQADEIRAVEPTFTANRWLATYPMTDRQQRERLAQALPKLGL
jgi:DNA-binding winged helix-turn-helix (wHTH) protein/TolB-like protein/tetratricopeptide (TPR) repeat protein